MVDGKKNIETHGRVDLMSTALGPWTLKLPESQDFARISLRVSCIEPVVSPVSPSIRIEHDFAMRQRHATRFLAFRLPVPLDS